MFYFLCRSCFIARAAEASVKDIWKQMLSFLRYKSCHFSPSIQRNNSHVCTSLPSPCPSGKLSSFQGFPTSMPTLGPARWPSGFSIQQFLFCLGNPVNFNAIEQLSSNTPGVNWVKLWLLGNRYKRRRISKIKSDPEYTWIKYNCTLNLQLVGVHPHLS